MFEVHQLPVLNDNYIYIIHEPISQSTAVVDPAISIPVLEFLKQKNWKLDFILNTHHHHDHTGANLDLKSRYPNCKILGSHSDHTRIPGIDILLKEDDVITLGRDTLSVLETPGHTLGHICFYASNQKLLFCGDTLFSLGCGKLFEGTAEQMWSSLLKIRALPDETLIYCAHEYTLANALFAMTIDPINQNLIAYYEKILDIRSQSKSTLPSSLGIEKATNPFLRADSHEIKNAMGYEYTSEWESFSRLRHLKDNFRTS